MPLNRIGAGGPFLTTSLGDNLSGQGCSFVSNAAMPQVANYALVAGLGFFLASAITPQGQANAAEYQFGLHAQAIHQAEGAKSFVRKSVVGKTPAVSLFTAGGIPQADPSQIAPSVWKSAAAPAIATGPVPLRFVWGTQESLDLSIGGWAVGGTQANQGPVPASVLTLPQDPTQIAAQIWKSQPAVVVITPNPTAPFFFVPPQNEERPTRAVWQSLRAGQTPPIIASFYAAPQQADFTQQALFIRPGLPTGPVPPATSRAPQTNTSQIVPQVWQSVPTPPAIAGVTVWPAIVAPPQFDTNTNPSVLWTPSTFSPGITPPAQDVSIGGGASGAKRYRQPAWWGDEKKRKLLKKIEAVQLQIEKKREQVDFAPDLFRMQRLLEQIAELQKRLMKLLEQIDELNKLAGDEEVMLIYTIYRSLH